jgi:spore maturation protein CgeB
MTIELLKKMDETEIVNIYGPKRSWEGFKSYIGEIAFDGESVIHQINKCGICLVLSSAAHIEDAVCSNRLFEGLAAGVPIISDKNPFIQSWFGDNIFYIDNLSSPDVALAQVINHITFFKENPENTLEKMKNCREIFINRFLLDKQLVNVLRNVKNYRDKGFSIIGI